MEQPKKMTLIQLTFMVAVNMMGSGIIMLPANMAQVGAISLLILARDGGRIDGDCLRICAGGSFQRPPRRHVGLR